MTAHFPREIIDRVKDSVDIVDVISSYLKLKKSGANYQALCPFHSEKTPSFSVSQVKQIFHCFGCGEGGNVLTFVMKYENLAFVDAVKMLAERGGVQLPAVSQPHETTDYSRLYELQREAANFYYKCLKDAPSGSVPKKYVEKRGISQATSEKFGLGFAPDEWDSLYRSLSSKKYTDRDIENAGLAKKSSIGNYIDTFRNRLIFPIVDEKKKVVAFGGRAMEEDEKGPKYINSPESPIYKKGRLLFGLNLTGDAIRREKSALIVEGYMDLIALYQAGVENVVATSGTAFTEYHARLLKRFTAEFVMVFDGDTAGRNAAERATATTLAEGIRPKIVMLPGGQDPDDLIRSSGKDGFDKLVAEAKPYISYLIDVACRKFDITTVEGKADTVRSLMPDLSKLSDQIERAGAVEVLSARLGIPAKRIEMRLPKIGTGEKEERKSPPKTQSKHIENVLLRIIIDHPDVVGTRLKDLIPEDFQSEDTRKVFQVIKGAIESGISQVSGLVDKLEEEGLGNYIRPLMMDESLYESEAWGTNLDNFISHIARKKNRGKMIKDMMEAAESMSREEFLKRQKEFRNLH